VWNRPPPHEVRSVQWREQSACWWRWSVSPSVIHNLQYFGAQRNAGFKLYKGTHRYKGHGYDYSYENRNGFTIDVEAGSNVKKTT
jgi:hypothetical protein